MKCPKCRKEKQYMGNLEWRCDCSGNEGGSYLAKEWEKIAEKVEAENKTLTERLETVTQILNKNIKRNLNNEDYILVEEKETKQILEVVSKEEKEMNWD